MRAGWLPLLSLAVPPGWIPGCPPDCAQENVAKIKRTNKIAAKRFRKLIFAIYSCISVGASGVGLTLDTKSASSGYVNQNRCSLHLRQNVTLEIHSSAAASRIRSAGGHLSCDGSEYQQRALALVQPGTVSVQVRGDRKSTRLNSSHANISYAVFCLKKKKKQSEYYYHT